MLFHLIQNKRVLFPTRSTVVWFTFGFKGGYHCDVKHQLPFACLWKKTRLPVLYCSKIVFEKKVFSPYVFMFKFFFLINMICSFCISLWKKYQKIKYVFFLSWPLVIMSFWLPNVNFLFLSDIKASRRIV